MRWMNKLLPWDHQKQDTGLLQLQSMLIVMLTISSCQSYKTELIQGCDQGRSSSGYCPPGSSTEGYLESPGYQNGSYNRNGSVYSYLFVNDHSDMAGRVVIHFTDLNIHPNSSLQIYRDPNRASMFTEIHSTHMLPKFTSLRCCLLIKFSTKCCNTTKGLRGFRLHYNFIKPCTHYQASCNNGICLSRKRFCDNRNDCGDASDETADVCPERRFQLLTWQKITLGCAVAALILGSYGYSYYRKRQRQVVRQQQPGIGRIRPQVNQTQPQPARPPPLPLPTQPLRTAPPAGHLTQPPSYEASITTIPQQNFGVPSDPPPAYGSLYDQGAGGAPVQKSS